MDLHIYQSYVDKKTYEELIVPGKDDCEERGKRVNTSNLNCESYAAKEKVIISVRLLRGLFLLPIEMEEKKESIAEKEAETRSDDIKNFNHVHNLVD